MTAFENIVYSQQENNKATLFLRCCFCFEVVREIPVYDTQHLLKQSFNPIKYTHKSVLLPGDFALD